MRSVILDIGLFLLKIVVVYAYPVKMSGNPLQEISHFQDKRLIDLQLMLFSYRALFPLYLKGGYYTYMEMT